MIDFILLFIVILLLIYNTIYKPHQYWKEKGIYHIKPWPIVGNLSGFLFGGTPFSIWLRNLCEKEDRRCFGIYEFFEPILIIKDVKLVKQIAIKDFDHFVDHKNFFTESKEPVFSDNLFSIKGQPWKNMRATLSPAFTGSKMRLMYDLIVNCAKEFTEFFENCTVTDEPTVLQMKDTFMRYSGDVLATCAFGIEVNSLKDRNNEFFLRGKDVSNFDGIRAVKFIGFSFIPKIMNFLDVRLYSPDLIDFFRNLVRTTVDHREKNNIYRPDMIHLLIEARKGKLNHETQVKDTDAGFATVEESYIGTQQSHGTELTDDDIAAQVLLFFIAGFEATSTTLSFMAYEIALQEEIQRKLQKEIDEIMEDCNGNVPYEKLMKMKYLDMVISETLRKYPTVPAINRVCVKPYTIEPENPGELPIHIEKNVSVWFPAPFLQYDPTYYPDPDKFIPERFSDDNKKNIDPNTYLPFGIGPRNCIGSRFALMSLKTITLHLLWKIDIVVVKETQIPMKLSSGRQIIASQDGIMLGFKKRIK